MPDTGREKTLPERLRQQGASLADFGLHAFRAQDLDCLLSRATQLLSEVFDVKLVKILELLPGGEELLVRAGVNWEPGIVGHATIGADERSPGGYALRTRQPVVSEDTAIETRFRIPQLLKDHNVRSMVNVIIPGDPAPFGVLELDATNITRFSRDDIAFLRNYANLIAAAVERISTQDRLNQVAEQRDLLLQEVQHRVKNMLMVVDALTTQTTTDSRSAAEFQQVLLGRLHAFGRAEMIVFEEQSEDLDLQALLSRILEAFLVSHAEQITMEGPPVSLAKQQAAALGLVMHELATNAAKYGALSREVGRVTLSWRLAAGEDGDRLALSWRETEGPPVAPPSKKGFGSRLIRHACSVQLKGDVDVSYDVSGVRCEIAFPLRERRRAKG